MTTRASITVASNRAPPKRRPIPDRPPDGYLVTEPELIETTKTPRDSVAAIRQAIAVIERLDSELIEIDEQIGTYETALSDPDADGWDRIDAEGKVQPLLTQRDVLRGQLLQAVGDLTSAGAVLVEAWRENLIDDIGRQLDHDGPLARVFAEFPGIETQAVWQRLGREAVPF